MTEKVQESKKRNKGNDFSKKGNDLKGQYQIIRKDILKLREDLQKGYDMARDLVDKKSLKQFLKTK